MAQAFLCFLIMPWIKSLQPQVFPAMIDWTLSNLKPTQTLPPKYYFWSVFDQSIKKKYRIVVPLPAIGKVKLYLYLDEWTP